MFVCLRDRSFLLNAEPQHTLDVLSDAFVYVEAVQQEA